GGGGEGGGGGGRGGGGGGGGGGGPGAPPPPAGGWTSRANYGDFAPVQRRQGRKRVQARRGPATVTGERPSRWPRPRCGGKAEGSFDPGARTLRPPILRPPGRGYPGGRPAMMSSPAQPIAPSAPRRLPRPRTCPA